MKKALWLSALGILVAVCAAAPLTAQQTGTITGRVTLPDGDPVAGATVEARSDVLPLPRATNTSSTGEFTLPLLPPGDYTVTFTLEGMASASRDLEVLLNQTLTVDVTMAPEVVTEAVTVVSESSIDRESAEIKTALHADVIEQLPIGKAYQDVVKLIPGVMYTEDTFRGPSAGGNGQDNVYMFDGVNVTLPLFGTLPTDFTSNDIDQISIVKGGAKAASFNRSGGFTIDSVSKSGTNEFHGLASYQIEDADWASERKTIATAFEEDREWYSASLGGPVLRDRLHFYASWFHPIFESANRANAYGAVPTREDQRDELFGKLSWSVTDNLLFNVSHRETDREITGRVSVDVPVSASTSLGDESQLGVTIAEASWVASQRSYATFKYTDFELDTDGRPDNRIDFPIRVDGSVRLDVANLDQQGLFSVPLAIPGQTGFNTFIVPLIERYGFLQNGVRTGGGRVGAGSTILDNDFFRESFQGGYDFMLGQSVTHELHVGYQWYRDEEDLASFSNGWGSISVCGGRTSGCSATGSTVPAGTFYVARFHQQTLEAPGGGRVVPVIHSEFESQSIELNDVIKWGNWAFNVGVLLSNDELFGQGLRPGASTPSGFSLAPGNTYSMYEVDFEDMVQPRLGAIWSYNGRDTVYANYARYHPAAGSLPRAASWDRNLAAEREAFFDASGNFLGSQALASSSGKFFDDELDPRFVDEYVLGTARQFSPRWTGRLSGRYRYGANFWEDTNNNARVAFNPPAGIPRELYIPNLTQLQNAGNPGGSSYVIAELDGAFTKYYEAALEGEWRGEKSFARGSYVWSHYYGNFDQDNTSTENDLNIFIGSSFIADAAGRQIWDKRYGDLRGDRRHQLKLYGYYNLPWNANVGAFGVYQSGQPWELWDVEPYRALTSSSSSASRFAEPAGSRRTSDHYQVDLSYTQDFPIGDRFNIQLRGNVFNITNNQTGYNIQNQVRGASGLLLNLGQPRDFYDPRRVQLAVAFQF